MIVIYLIYFYFSIHSYCYQTFVDYIDSLYSLQMIW